ncbi:MAG: DUF5995 family protein [Solirubrobacteraceae bacterium]|nr:DUF5995 family protein [Solirubrobacteraceae bacterium]
MDADDPIVDPIEHVADRMEAIAAPLEIKDRFTTGIVRDIDRLAGRGDDVLASWSVSHARDNAWTQAQILAALDGSDFLRKQFLLALGRNVGFAGRALLIAAP